MQVTRWSADQGPVELSRLFAALHEEGLQAQLINEMPGARYETHQHARAEIRWLVKGSLTLGVRLREVEGRPLPEGMEWVELELEPGDRLDLPAGTDHWAMVGPQGATYLVAHR